MGNVQIIDVAIIDGSNVEYKTIKRSDLDLQKAVKVKKTLVQNIIDGARRRLGIGTEQLPEEREKYLISVSDGYDTIKTKIDGFPTIPVQVLDSLSTYVLEENGKTYIFSKSIKTLTPEKSVLGTAKFSKVLNNKNINIKNEDTNEKVEEVTPVEPTIEPIEEPKPEVVVDNSVVNEPKVIDNVSEEDIVNEPIIVNTEEATIEDKLEPVVNIRRVEEPLVNIFDKAKELEPTIEPVMEPVVNEPISQPVVEEKALTFEDVLVSIEKMSLENKTLRDENTNLIKANKTAEQINTQQKTELDKVKEENIRLVKENNGIKETLKQAQIDRDSSKQQLEKLKTEIDDKITMMNQRIIDEVEKAKAEKDKQFNDRLSRVIKTMALIDPNKESSIVK